MQQSIVLYHCPGVEGIVFFFALICLLDCFLDFCVVWDVVCVSGMMQNRFIIRNVRCGFTRTGRYSLSFGSCDSDAWVARLLVCSWRTYAGSSPRCYQVSTRQEAQDDTSSIGLRGKCIFLFRSKIIHQHVRTMNVVFFYWPFDNVRREITKKWRTTMRQIFEHRSLVRSTCHSKIVFSLDFFFLFFFRRKYLPFSCPSTAG